MPDVLRPTLHLRAVQDEYPRMAALMDDFRARRGKDLPTWPAWCFCPMAAAAAIARVPGPNLAGATHMQAIAALSAWRVTQGIYTFDPTIFEALWETPVTGQLPERVLYHLPEWCCYVQCPTPRPFLRARLEDDAHVHSLWLHGFFVHLEWDVHREEAELRFLADVEGPAGVGLLPLSLHLVGGTLEAAVAAADAEAQRQLRETVSADEVARLRSKGLTPPPVAEMVTLLAPLVSLTLYLASVAAEMRDHSGVKSRPVNPQPTKTKRGPRFFPPDRHTVWDVAWRMEAALRRAQEQAAPAVAGASQGLRERVPVRAHIRRAHWALYWTGKGRTVPRVRWLHPILVNADVGEIVATLHPVEA